MQNAKVQKISQRAKAILPGVPITNGEDLLMEKYSAPLKNSKHEKFAQYIAKGHTLFEAHSLAGYRENRGNASRMKSNENIQGRAEYLKKEASQKVLDELEIDQKFVTEGLLEVIDDSKDLDDSSAALGQRRLALMDIAKLHGLVIDKKDTTVKFDRLDEVYNAILESGGDLDGSE